MRVVAASGSMAKEFELCFRESYRASYLAIIYIFCSGKLDVYMILQLASQIKIHASPSNDHQAPGIINTAHAYIQHVGTCSKLMAVVYLCVM